ncbi:MAG: tRNA (adenosine(37)-N6)-threonylcarbamoyltransferase complex ATPase subunit type 1 TsaE [Chitinophagaceae bacterium]|jgi:tRNA threonylcarbamoyladenosine biosynthesis protein TsaE
MNRVFELHELDDVAMSLLKNFQDKRIFAFHAPMGSGKTTLIAALCKQLGVTDHPSSPTFSIINEYALTQSHSVYHMDWYRLKHTEDAIEAGVQDILEMQDVYIFIEWPEMAAELLQGLPVLHIQLELVDELKRRIVTE